MKNIAHEAKARLDKQNEENALLEKLAARQAEWPTDRLIGWQAEALMFGRVVCGLEARALVTKLGR